MERQQCPEGVLLSSLAALGMTKLADSLFEPGKISVPAHTTFYRLASSISVSINSLQNRSRFFGDLGGDRHWDHS
jgi:hypothetical protein